MSINGYILNNYNLKKISRYLSVCLDNSLEYFADKIVIDNLSFPLENLHYTKEEINSSITSIAKKFKIDNILDKSFNDITSSEKIKVVIATAIIYKPKILLIDFPLDKLTSSDRKLIIKILLDYQKKDNGTIILVTNNLEDTLFSDRIILLDKGKIIMDDSKEGVYKDNKLENYGFTLPFIVALSHNLMLYDLLDKVYYDKEEVVKKLWD